MSRLGGGDGGRGGGGDGGPNDPAWSSNAMGQFQSQGGHLGWNFKCQRYLGSITAAVLAVLAVMTPVAMVLLPRMQIVPLRSEQLRCPAECEGLLITLTVKLVLLVLGSWAVFWRPTRATMPRIFFLRTLVLLLVFVTTFAYCLFYGVRVVEQQDQLDYKVNYISISISFVIYFWVPGRSRAGMSCNSGRCNSFLGWLVWFILWVVSEFKSQLELIFFFHSDGINKYGGCIPCLPAVLFHLSTNLLQHFCVFLFYLFLFGFIQAIVTFALSLVDALLFVHYAAVLLLEIRQMPPRYYLHVIRSPDGISRGYPIGAVSKFCCFSYFISIV